MQSMSAKDATYGFGRLIHMPRAEPVIVEKHGRPVGVVLATREFALLQRKVRPPKTRVKPRSGSQAEGEGRP